MDEGDFIICLLEWMNFCPFGVYWVMDELGEVTSEYR